MLFYIENGGFIYSDFILTSIDLIKSNIFGVFCTLQRDP